MNEMTQTSRHRIRNSSLGGLMPCTVPMGHVGSPQYFFLRVDGEETFLFVSNRRDRGTDRGTNPVCPRPFISSGSLLRTE